VLDTSLGKPAAQVRVALHSKEIVVKSWRQASTEFPSIRKIILVGMVESACIR